MQQQHGVHRAVKCRMGVMLCSSAGHELCLAVQNALTACLPCGQWQGCPSMAFASPVLWTGSACLFTVCCLAAALDVVRQPHHLSR